MTLNELELHFDQTKHVRYTQAQDEHGVPLVGGYTCLECAEIRMTSGTDWGFI